MTYTQEQIEHVKVVCNCDERKAVEVLEFVFSSPWVLPGLCVAGANVTREKLIDKAEERYREGLMDLPLDELKRLAGE